MEALSTIALVAGACALIYIACNLPENAAKREEASKQRELDERKTRRYAAQLAAGVGSTFSFELSDLSLALGGPMAGGTASVVGTVLDCDDEWVLVSIAQGKRRRKAMIRYTQIETLKEVAP